MADISTGTLTFPGFSPSTYFRFCRLKSRSRLPFFKISTHCEMSLKSLQREWTALVAYCAATASYVFACWKYCVNSQYIDFFHLSVFVSFYAWMSTTPAGVWHRKTQNNVACQNWHTHIRYNWRLVQKSQEAKWNLLSDSSANRKWRDLLLAIASQSMITVSILFLVHLHFSSTFYPLLFYGF